MLPVSERDHVQGRIRAPVVLVEYGDFECPDCKAAYPLVKTLQARFGDDLCFVYRHFPLIEKHLLAAPAAEASEAAGAQNLFWQMHDLLFESSPVLDRLSQFAREIGADTHRFDRALRSRTYRPRVEQDIEDGAASGVHGTPSFFINGVRHEGGHDLDSLVEALRVAR
jgi:protein-disulfide isomerase